MLQDSTRLLMSVTEAPPSHDSWVETQDIIKQGNEEKLRELQHKVDGSQVPTTQFHFFHQVRTVLLNMPSSTSPLA